jgi:hypothetical protein
MTGLIKYDVLKIFVKMLCSNSFVLVQYVDLTLFWSDPWLGGIPLSVTYGRLFDLAETKLSTVADIFSVG